MNNASSWVTLFLFNRPTLTPYAFLDLGDCLQYEAAENPVPARILLKLFDPGLEKHLNHTLTHPRANCRSISSNKEKQSAIHSSLQCLATVAVNSPIFLSLDWSRLAYQTAFIILCCPTRGLDSRYGLLKLAKHVQSGVAQQCLPDGLEVRFKSKPVSRKC